MKNRFLALIFIQSVCICLGSLLSQPKTYVRIILIAVKGCASVKQSCVHANCDQRQNLPYFMFLLKKLLYLYTVGFCDQGASWSSSCDEYSGSFWYPCIPTYSLVDYFDLESRREVFRQVLWFPLWLYITLLSWVSYYFTHYPFHFSIALICSL